MFHKNRSIVYKNEASDFNFNFILNYQTLIIKIYFHVPYLISAFIWRDKQEFERFHDLVLTQALYFVS